MVAMDMCAQATSFCHDCVCRSRKPSKPEGSAAWCTVPSISCCKTRPHMNCVAGDRPPKPMNCRGINMDAAPCHCGRSHWMSPPHASPADVSAMLLSKKVLEFDRFALLSKCKPPKVPLAARTSSSVAWCWRAHSCRW